MKKLTIIRINGIRVRENKFFKKKRRDKPGLSFNK